MVFIYSSTSCKTCDHRSQIPDPRIPHFEEVLLHAVVVVDVALDLAFPEVLVRLGERLSPVVASVPEGSIHEHRHLVFHDGDVGRARQFPVVDAVAQTPPPQHPPQDQLRFRVFGGVGQGGK